MRTAFYISRALSVVRGFLLPALVVGVIYFVFFTDWHTHIYDHPWLLAVFFAFLLLARFAIAIVKKVRKL